MAGLSYLNITDWRYENVGLAQLLSISGTTLNDLTLDKSLTSTAFYQTTRAKCFNLPASPQIWAKFDVYFDGSNRWRAYNYGNGGNQDLGISSLTNGSLTFFYKGTTVYNASGICKTNQLQTVLLHMVSGTNGLIEAWVDGTKIYTYNGDVNHGDAFADFYLQSDGAGTFFSNVIISNVQIGLNENIPADSLTVKPELYASLLPYGDLPQKISVDLLRAIAKTEKITADIKRQMGATQKNSTDLLRAVTKTEKIIGDTSRQVTNTIFALSKAYADLLRKVTTTEQYSADTARLIGVKEKVSVNTVRSIAQINSIATDTLLRIGTTEKLSAEILLRLRHFARCDTERKISRRNKRKADTIIRVPHIMKYYFQQQSTLRAMKAPTKAKVQTSKNRSIVDDLFSGYNPFGDWGNPFDNSSASIVNTFDYYGVTRVTVTLNERTLSDNFEIEFVNADNAYVPTMGETIQFQLLDYNFEFVVEERVTTPKNIIIKGQYNKDSILDQKFKLQTEETIGKSAKNILDYIASKMELGLNDNFDDFVPANFDGVKSMTYREIVSNLFGWSSEVPTIQVNVFIREKVLYVLQRGKETNEINLAEINDNGKPTYPIANEQTAERKLPRLGSYQDDTDTEDDDDDDDVPFSGTIGFGTGGGHVFCTYSGGLLVKEDIGISTGNIKQTSTTTYTYKTVMTQTEQEDKEDITDQEDLDLISTEQGTFARTGDETFVKVGEADNNTGNELNNFVEHPEIESIRQTANYYLGSKTQKTTSSNIEGRYYHTTDETNKTDYFYKGIGDDIYLCHERNIATSEEKYEYMYAIIVDTIKSRTKTTITRRDTYHFPAGNGFYIQVVYVDGKFQGGNISTGKPGNAVSLHTVKAIQSNFQLAKQANEKAEKELQDKVLGDFKQQISDIMAQMKDKTFEMTIDERQALGRQIENMKYDKTGAKGVGYSYAVALESMLSAYNPTGGNVNFQQTFEDAGIDASEFIPTQTSDIEKGETVKLGGAFSVLTGDNEDTKALYKRCLQEKLALSGAIETTYTCDIVCAVKDSVPDVNHIIDFTDKTSYGYLVSNKITFTPKKLVQSLTLRSWG